ncbi:hypothetical protein ABIB15_000121 [Marisediminicola sp. UYEF4]|uniref:hypothetical protein n=1 Tax=Marisediminicola sp. UYEF4 TaxID=1756384 RepID=UPI0033922072
MRQFTMRQPPIGDGVDISVVHGGHLLPLLSGRPVFSPEEVQRIMDAAVRPRTWSITTPREPGVAQLISV